MNPALNPASKRYNTILINLFKNNKITLFCFSIVTALGYISLPYLEKYHKSVKMKTSKKIAKDEDTKKISKDEDTKKIAKDEDTKKIAKDEDTKKKDAKEKDSKKE